jgi:Na+/H+ antiporter NhaD/arsenite permease-like protein
VEPEEEEEEEDLSIEALEERYKIHNMNLFVSSCIVVGFVLLMFFLRSPLQIPLSLTWIAIIGAMVHMLVAGVHDVNEMLEKVEWGALLFFGCLFILMRALEELGLMEYFAGVTADLIKTVSGDKMRLIAAVLLIIWSSAFVSAFIENIPFTTAMVPVIVQLSNSHLNLPLSPLAWALVFGGCFGGNATIMASAANVIAISIAEQEGYTITFTQFSKLGIPVVLLTCSIASLYMILLVEFGWHEAPQP